MSASAPNASGPFPLPWATLYQLLKFRFENTPAYLRRGLVDPDPEVDLSAEIGPDTIRDAILFAGGSIGNGDPTVPRQLEAWRVLQLVPDEYGAALFGVPMPS